MSFEKPKVIVSVDPVGGVHIETVGFAGDSCAVATKDLERVLISKDGTMTEEKKDEYYQQGESLGQMVDNLRL